ncbi:VCBS repeat-containing protein [Actinomyces weissii]|uniref:FG-GAP repeat protein n=1 Tax=Actinomyces weissii TaxID=675090 RepID=A0A7T7MAF1_9ACTO|nr:VCBS repeat-containing protein [Actinomyces weissii]QQM67880.1 FG-GAP repeat protein [Actinomyces weissii]
MTSLRPRPAAAACLLSLSLILSPAAAALPSHAPATGYEDLDDVFGPEPGPFPERPARPGDGSSDDDDDLFGPSQPPGSGDAPTTPEAPRPPAPGTPGDRPRTDPPVITPPPAALQPVDTDQEKSWLGEFGNSLGSTIARGTCDVTGDARPDIITSELTRSVWRFDPYYVDTENHGWVHNVTGRLVVVPGGAPGTALPSEHVIYVNGPTEPGEEGDDAVVGLSVACLGDTNGDGVDDLAVGSHTMGRAWVLYGGPRLHEARLNDLAPEHGFTVLLPTTGSPAAHLSAAGDLDGDGLADLALVLTNSRQALSPAPGQGTDRGIAYVVAGHAGGAAVDLREPLAEPQHLLARVLSPAGNLATAFDRVGDVNADGQEDFVLSDYTHASGTNVVPGRAWLLTGVRPGARLDLDGEFAGSTLEMDPSASYRLGAGTSVAPAGDADGDGVGDLLIGFDGGHAVGVTTGGVVLVRGSAQLPATVRISPTGQQDPQARVITGLTPGDSAGYAVDALVAPGTVTLVALGAQGTAQEAGATYVFPVSAFSSPVRSLAELGDELRTIASPSPRSRSGRAVAFVGSHLGSPTLAVGGDGVVHDHDGEEGAVHAAHVLATTVRPVPAPAAPQGQGNPGGGPGAPGGQPGAEEPPAGSGAGSSPTPSPAPDSQAQAGPAAQNSPSGLLARTGAGSVLAACALAAAAAAAGGLALAVRARRRQQG